MINWNLHSISHLNLITPIAHLHFMRMISTTCHAIWGVYWRRTIWWGAILGLMSQGSSASLLTVSKFKTTKVYIHLLHNLYTSIVWSIFINRLVSCHLNQFLCWCLRRLVIYLLIVFHLRCFTHSIINDLCIRLSIRRRGHQWWQKWLILFMRLICVISLSVDSLLYKRIELILRDILELLSTSTSATYEPLKDFLKSSLSTLLIGNIVAECWLLIQLCQRISRLLETNLQTVQVNVCAPTRWSRMRPGSSRMGAR
jgi:hypothetical protein